jgi:uncharacterized membrane protein YphA (DoxX/SURF4 family)
MLDGRLNSPWWALRIGLGLGPLLAGVDKFFNILANWPTYLSPMAERFLPVSATMFMHVVGVIEIIVGVAILTRWTRIFSYVAMIWLLCIAANLVTTGRFFDIAVRDVLLSLAAFTLARLTEARETAVASEPIRQSEMAPHPRAA